VNANSKRLNYIFITLAVLAIGQVIWWSYLLISQHEELTRFMVAARAEGASEQLLRFKTMIISESAFFIAIWTLAMWSAFRFTREQSGLRQAHSDFLSAITHELKTPIANIQLSFETLERPSLPDEMRSKYIQRGLAACSRLQQEIEAVLIMTNTNISSRDTAMLPLADLVDQCAQAARETAGEKCIIETKIDPTLHVLGAPEETRLILRNLIDNSIKYHAAATEAYVTISAALDADQKRVRLTVQDRGLGMTVEDLEKAFQPFWRAEHSKIAAKAGTGLGLALARSLASSMKMKVFLESGGLGHGTTAHVIFPRGLK
jgi:two-component system phosphate regulon sensor histidine kinase PhoR